MCSLLFTYRKLSLTRQRNELQADLMSLDMRLYSATQQVSEMQQMISDAKNSMSIFSATTFNNQLQEYMSGVSTKQKNGETINDYEVQKHMMDLRQVAAANNSMATSIFEAGEQIKLRQLQSIENHLQLQKKSKETMLTQVEAQLKNTESAESKSMEDRVSKFGLGNG